MIVFIPEYAKEASQNSDKRIYRKNTCDNISMPKVNMKNL